MLEVLTAADDKSLIELPTLKDELGISDTSEDDYLNRLISAASARIVRYTGREFAKETVKETIGSSGGYRLMLERTPIVSITSITLDGDTVDATDYAIENPEAGFLRWLNFPITNTTLYQKYLTLAPSRYNQLLYVVTYIGGYSLIPNTGEYPIPDDIQQAAIELCKSWYVLKGRDSSITWERIGDAEERRSDPTKMPMSPAAKVLLQAYQRLDLPA